MSGSHFGGWRADNDPFLSKARIAKSAKISLLFRVFGDPQNLTIGEHARIDDFTVFVCTGLITIGDGCHVASFVKINGEGSVDVRAGAQISSGVQIYSASDDLVRRSANGRGRAKVSGPIVIGSGAIIGANCVVLPGADIGVGATVAALSVVGAGRTQAWMLSGGIPAKAIKDRIVANG